MIQLCIYQLDKHDVPDDSIQVYPPRKRAH